MTEEEEFLKVMEFFESVINEAPDDSRDLISYGMAFISIRYIVRNDNGPSFIHQLLDAIKNADTDKTNRGVDKNRR